MDPLLLGPLRVTHYKTLTLPRGQCGAGAMGRWMYRPEGARWRCRVCRWRLAGCLVVGKQPASLSTRRQRVLPSVPPPLPGRGCRSVCLCFACLARSLLSLDVSHSLSPLPPPPPRLCCRLSSARCSLSLSLAHATLHYTTRRQDNRRSAPLSPCPAQPCPFPLSLALALALAHAPAVCRPLHTHAHPGSSSNARVFGLACAHGRQWEEGRRREREREARPTQSGSESRAERRRAEQRREERVNSTSTLSQVSTRRLRAVEAYQLGLVCILRP